MKALILLAVIGICGYSIWQNAGNKDLAPAVQVLTDSDIVRASAEYMQRCERAEFEKTLEENVDYVPRKPETED